MAKNKKRQKKRDIAILLSYKGELDLRIKVVRDKKKYSRKVKHKKKIFE